MSRLWPGGLAWRIVGVVLLVVVVVQAIGLALFVVDRGDRARELLRATSRQIVATTRLYERVPEDARDLVLDAVGNPLIRLRHSGELGFLAAQGFEPAPFWIAAGVRQRLRPLAERDVRVFVRRPFADDTAPRLRRGEEPPGPPRWRRGRGEFEPSRRRLAVSVPLVDGGWLTFIVASEATAVGWLVRSALYWALILAVVLIAAIWASGRVAKPFRRFAAAADQLGTDLRAPLLPETGSGELRQAVRAFNRMQERIRRMVDDRTLMLGAISHDLRTMLTRLRLRVELIDDDAQRAKAEADLDEMQAMLEGTLAFAKSQTAADASESVDLAALLQTIADDAVVPEAALDYAGPDRCVVWGRPVALRRLFANLATNAVRYGGGGTIRLETSDDAVVIAVEDAGPGVREPDLERMFEPFVRLETSRSRETGGAGLGLAIARTIAREHGGEITLANRQPTGLVATVVLPLASAR